MTEALQRDYTIGEELGSGKYGVVFRCHPAGAFNGEGGERGRFAVKSICKREIKKDEVDRQCLYNEVKIMQLVSSTRPHKNVLKVFDAYEDDEFLHIVVECCDSSDLFERLKKKGVFTEAEAIDVMVPLMEAIAHCHRCGVAHRDIKPENILFDDYNDLKIADFGSAKCFCEGQLISGIVGTPYYVAPEVLARRKYNEKVDVWSAGVVLYIMLAGTPPFYGEPGKEIFEAVIKGNLRFPSRLFSSISPEAKDLLRRMLCKDVSRRLSAEQVLRHPWMTRGGDTRELATWHVL